jgi:hypothetical protein
LVLAPTRASALDQLGRLSSAAYALSRGNLAFPPLWFEAETWMGRTLRQLPLDRGDVPPSGVVDNLHVGSWLQSLVGGHAASNGGAHRAMEAVGEWLRAKPWLLDHVPTAGLIKMLWTLAAWGGKHDAAIVDTLTAALAARVAVDPACVPLARAPGVLYSLLLLKRLDAAEGVGMVQALAARCRVAAGLHDHNAFGASTRWCNAPGRRATLRPPLPPSLSSSLPVVAVAGAAEMHQLQRVQLALELAGRDPSLAKALHVPPTALAGSSVVASTAAAGGLVDWVVQHNRARQAAQPSSLLHAAALRACQRLAQEWGLPAPVWEWVTPEGLALDIAWPDLKLAVEVDGLVHFQPLSVTAQVVNLSSLYFSHAAWARNTAAWAAAAPPALAAEVARFQAEVDSSIMPRSGVRPDTAFAPVIHTASVSSTTRSALSASAHRGQSAAGAAGVVDAHFTLSQVAMRCCTSRTYRRNAEVKHRLATALGWRVVHVCVLDAPHTADAPMGSQAHWKAWEALVVTAVSEAMAA